MRYLALLIPLAAAAAGCSDDNDSPTGPSGSRVSFFVTSQTSVTGNLGGLAGADATCRQLATAAGHGANRIWRAYLSVERGPDGQPIHARDRIGPGPVVQRPAPAAGQQPRRAARPRGRRRAVPGRARASASTGNGPDPRRRSSTTSSPDRMPTAPWRSGSPAPTGPRTPPRPWDRSATRTASGRARAGPAPWPRGTPRTPTRTARTRRRAAGPAASTASRSRWPAAGRMLQAGAACYSPTAALRRQFDGRSSR